jgi:hypothetical protein
MPTAGRTPFAAAHGVVHRVHGHAAHPGPRPASGLAAGFAEGQVLVFHIAQLPHRGLALEQYHAHFARRQLDQGIAILLGHQLGEGAGAAHNLPAFAQAQFDVVNMRAQGNVGQGQCIAGLDIGILVRTSPSPTFKFQRGQDIALFAVGIVEQRDARAAIGIVLDRCNLGRYTVLVPPEIDDAVIALVPPPRRAVIRP